MAEAKLRVLVTSHERILFDGMAARVIVPGEQGTCEVLPLHRPLMSRLLKGVVSIDDKRVPIRRGIMHVLRDVVTAVVETPEPSR